MDARWEKPIQLSTASRQPWCFRGSWDVDETDRFRHVHCVHYEACLDDACKTCRKSMTMTWACPSNCPGRKTFKN